MNFFINYFLVALNCDNADEQLFLFFIFGFCIICILLIIGGCMDRALEWIPRLKG